MKIIPLHTRKEQRFSEILLLLKKKDRGTQEKVFAQYAPKMLGVCRQYIKDIHQAEEVMLNGFFKVFTKVNSFTGKGNFEGWIRRIMVNECISFLRHHHKLVFIESEKFFEEKSSVEELDSTLDKNEDGLLQNLVDNLREDLRTVFNLFVIEGYKHKEIGFLLNISENASKMKYRKAKNILREQYQQITLKKYEL